MANSGRRYTQIIQKAKTPLSETATETVENDNDMSGEPESQTNVGAGTEDQPARQPRRSKKADSQKAGKPENQQTRKLANQKSQATEVVPEVPKNKEEGVNLCVKVSPHLRRYWAAQSKLRGKTMTEVMIEALKREFGEPD